MFHYTRECTVSCPYRDANHPPVFPEPVASGVKVMFIGENPSWKENLKVPLDPASISGRALEENYLGPLGLKREEVWITNLIKCRHLPAGKNKVKSKLKLKAKQAATACANLWLVKEIWQARPLVIVTLSDKEVYQRIRHIFNLPVPANFEKKAVGKSHPVEIGGVSTRLFPMVHPDISRYATPQDRRKAIARDKWAPIHHNQHLPALRQLLEEIG